MTQQAYDKIAAGLADITKGHVRVAKAAEGAAQSVERFADRVRAFNAVDYLKTEEDIAAYLAEARESGDPALIAAADADAARAKQMRAFEEVFDEDREVFRDLAKR